MCHPFGDIACTEQMLMCPTATLTCAAFWPCQLVLMWILLLNKFSQETISFQSIRTVQLFPPACLLIPLSPALRQSVAELKLGLQGCEGFFSSLVCLIKGNSSLVECGPPSLPHLIDILMWLIRKRSNCLLKTSGSHKGREKSVHMKQKLWAPGCGCEGPVRMPALEMTSTGALSTMWCDSPVVASTPSISWLLCRMVSAFLGMLQVSKWKKPLSWGGGIIDEKEWKRIVSAVTILCASSAEMFLKAWCLSD